MSECTIPQLSLRGREAKDNDTDPCEDSLQTTQENHPQSVYCRHLVGSRVLWLAFMHLFEVLLHFQHYTGHITTGSWKGRGNQYI